MSTIEIRRATQADISAIVEIEAGEEGPWAEIDSCRAWVLKRLARGFYIQLAYLDGLPAGHGEWVPSDEPGGKTFYLGQLQVKKAFQRMGVGRAMMKDGEAEARRLGCESVTLIPDTQTGADAFYARCGYQRSRTLLRATGKAEAGVPAEMIDSIPERVVREKRFVAGLMQTASRHIWELIEHAPDERNVRRARVPGGYVALMWHEGHVPSALAWGDFDAEGARAGCAALAKALGFSAFEFIYDADEVNLPEVGSFEFEMEKRF
jgi:predicted N-acetyltransferase YhbS